MKCLALLAALALSSSVAAAEPTAPPKTIDRTMIVAAVNAVKPEADACGTKGLGTGIVKITVRVMPSGNTESVTIKEAKNKPLGACVLAAFKKISFPATQEGGSFAYPFVFR